MQALQKKNYESYLKMRTESYTGEWVIICEGRVVAHGKSLKKAVSDAKKQCGEKRFMIVKIPSKETMIY